MLLVTKLETGKDADAGGLGVTTYAESEVRCLRQRRNNLTVCIRKQGVRAPGVAAFPLLRSRRMETTTTRSDILHSDLTGIIIGAVSEGFAMMNHRKRGASQPTAAGGTPPATRSGSGDQGGSSVISV